MSTTTIAGNPTEAYARILEQGYGPDSWHGPSLAAALADVTAEMAFRRPAEGRHNIAEIALHHAYTAHALRGRLSGAPPEPFVLDGEDWFTVEDGKTLSWAQVRATLDAEQARLADLASAIALVLRLCSRYRLPDPARRAHQLTREIRRQEP